MKIEFQTGLPAYRKANGQPAAKANAASADRSGKTDVIDISRGQSPQPDGGTASLKGNILQEVAASTSPSKLEELQDKIKSGSYRPSTEEIIDAILAD